MGHRNVVANKRNMAGLRDETALDNRRFRLFGKKSYDKRVDKPRCMIKPQTEQPN